MTAIRAGDQVTATVDDTTGATVTVDLAVQRVDELGCGCRRIAAARPGPDAGTRTCRTVHLITGCGHGHDNDITMQRGGS
jgi:hypothetical protein